MADDSRLYVSSTSFRQRRLESVLAACHRAGVTGLELSALDDWQPELLEAQSSIRYLVHNYCPPPTEPFVLNLASPDPGMLERSLEHCRRSLDLCAALNSPIYAAHAGFAVDLNPALLGDPEGQAGIVRRGVPEYEETYFRLVESARTLTSYAKARGIRFLIENHALSSLGGDAGRRLLPMVTRVEFQRLLADVADDEFGVLLDVGHLNVSARALGFDRVDFIEALAPSIGGFHLSDNDGLLDEHRAFGGDAWFLPFLRACPDVPVTIELERADLDAIVKVRDVVASVL